MKSSKPYWLAIVSLSLALAGALSILLTGQPTSLAEDGRKQIHLSSEERKMVLGEMRRLLESSQLIVQGLADQNLNSIEKAASAVGSKAITTVDLKLAPKLPPEFRQLGFGTHKAFDEIAQLARDKQSPEVIQSKLATTMNNCVSCHAAYQIPELRIKK